MTDHYERSNQIRLYRAPLRTTKINEGKISYLEILIRLYKNDYGVTLNFDRNPICTIVFRKFHNRHAEPRFLFISGISFEVLIKLSDDVLKWKHSNYECYSGTFTTTDRENTII